MSAAQLKMAAQIESISAYLKEVKPNKIPVDEYEDYYKKLRGIKELFEKAPWDEIEKEKGMEDVTLARKDEPFKEYYKLRMEADRLRGFVK